MQLWDGEYGIPKMSNTESNGDESGARVAHELENSDGKVRHQFGTSRYNGSGEEKDGV